MDGEPLAPRRYRAIPEVPQEPVIVKVVRIVHRPTVRERLHVERVSQIRHQRVREHHAAQRPALAVAYNRRILRVLASRLQSRILIVHVNDHFIRYLGVNVVQPPHEALLEILPVTVVHTPRIQQHPSVGADDGVAQRPSQTPLPGLVNADLPYIIRPALIQTPEYGEGRQRQPRHLGIDELLDILILRGGQRNHHRSLAVRKLPLVEEIRLGYTHRPIAGERRLERPVLIG